MAKYSLEIRKAALQAYKQTDYKVAVCKTFNISRVTLDAWIKLEEETGDLQPKARQKSGAPSHIKDLDKFQVFVKNTKFKNISDLVPLFEQQFGYAVSYAVLVRAIHNLGLKRGRGRFYY
ncbi:MULTISPECIES: helix-turn-helix domain-containing protein [unclassified Acinetobacter]|uniref:helix-turn-helix domain-containing protein n=1 Tax=unclassified Acinetobacter TaxID=196816 RepID=UPI002934E97D|nr:MULTISPECIES: helix-turn-helix domain-containing protein [unclassified Acinetobacter]WOE31030.1 helix-turn-helix domain-containing protein [Acinetobacter sp. SAAs470]WOE39226.1 helix-turn-helix domain-containing protein [Acinetobacter sp. SAAs474]